jgi:MYXO-CTERM domain-containing protein
VPMLPIETSLPARKVGVCASMWRSAAAPLAAAAIAALILIAPRTASAFQIETSTTSACHEGITLDALERAGWPDGRDAPPLDETAERIADDVPFDLPEGARDLWTIALLIGIRHNDVGANDPFDLPALSVMHGDPDRQPEHCLRQPEQDGEEGDRLALDACRAFLVAQLELALGGGEGGETNPDESEIDMDATVRVKTHLLFRGEVELDLPAYPFHLGRALHALQDSYSHTFRNPGSEQVQSVLNWVEGNLDGNSDLARDGHPHLTALDECGGGAGNLRRRGWAVDASAEVMTELARSAAGREERLDRARAVFADHTRRQAGCSVDNDWCDSPDAEPSSGCSAGSSGSGGSAWPLPLLALAAIAGARRRHASRNRRARALGIAMAAALLVPAGASAQSDQPGEDAQEQEQKDEADQGAQEANEAEAEQSEASAEQSLEREERVIKRLPDPVRETWGAAISLGAAFDRGAGAVSVGARWNPWRDVGFGLDAEYNPWVSVSGFEVASGAASLYVPVTWRLKRFGTWELRTTAYVGATTILFDLVGVDSGTVGLFAGWNPLGLALPLGPHTKLVVKPGDIAVSAPQLRGIPFYYTQYRFTVGVEWYP